MIVREPFFLARCNSCGLEDSSEAFLERKYLDDADMECPSCGSVNTESVDGGEDAR